MIREAKPVPGALKRSPVVPAPKISSLAEVVVAAPLFGVALAPAAPAVTSSGLAVSRPLYSSIRTST